MFLKDSPTESRKFLFEIKEECKVLKIIFVKNNFVSDLLGRQHLLQILQTSLTIKNSEKVVKLDVSKNVCDGEDQFFSK